jgi:PAS domain S-box-containing protein
MFVESAHMTDSKISKNDSSHASPYIPALRQERQRKLFDTSVIGDSQEAIDFITNILESSTEYSIIAQDMDGKILLWNEGARRLYGYEQDEVIGKMVSSMLHTHEDLQAGLPQKIMADALAHGKFEGTVSRRRKNDDKFTARLVITPRYDPAGKSVGFLIISKDISYEIQMAQYARSLIEASLDPLLTISVDGKITDVNEAATKATGVPRDKLIGTDFSSYFTDPHKAQEAYRQGFARGMLTDYPLTIRQADGGLIDVLYNASVYRDERGNVLGVFAAARDVTTLKQAESKVAEQRGKELEKLAELVRFQKLTMGRELRMIDLKKEIEDLKKEIGDLKKRAA